MPAPANPDVAWAIEDIRANLPRRQKALNYYQGEHPLNFATNKFRNTFGELFQELADNLCDDVVDEPTDRLQIDNWSGKAATAAQEWWETQRGDARSGSVHKHGHRAGDAFVIVWDNGDDQPRMYVQDPRQMAIRYSQTDPDKVEVAAKCWREGKGYRLNLYYGPKADPRDPAARVEHYYSKGFSTQSGEKGIPNATAFLEYDRAVLDANGQPDVVEWYEKHDKPRNPVFHFPCGELGQYGQSVLHDVYPLQDALNKVLCDFLVAGEDSSLPKRYATGIQVQTDPVTGQEISPFKDGQNLWWTRSHEAAFGQFPAAEMKGFLDSMRDLRLAIARKGALPAHTVDIGGTSGNAPSGLSLLISEGKLLKRCKDRARDWGVVWRELVAFALSWTGTEVKPEDLTLDWAPFETRDEQALLEALMLKKTILGEVLPIRQLAREAGYSDTDLDDMAKEAEDERAQDLDAEHATGGGRVSQPGSMVPRPPAPPAGAREPAVAGAGV